MAGTLCTRSTDEKAEHSFGGVFRKVPNISTTDSTQMEVGGIYLHRQLQVTVKTREQVQPDQTSLGISEEARN